MHAGYDEATAPLLFLLPLLLPLRLLLLTADAVAPILLASTRYILLRSIINYYYYTNQLNIDTGSIRLLIVISSTTVTTAVVVRPRWLGRVSSCLLKSISRIQFSPSAHARRDFFLCKKLISGKRESEGLQHSMQIDEQLEC